ncbi:hypothetical protein [Bdellovibrio bacteriovorus]|uniref:Uncharacterized protein n=1 Tax=Bdellovibrio bacteriovorus str. Tiberius TaxID=1069642 RepID=K7ZBE0_BDEBC|nr:hypothetical protein [Bdellovibrio bacteriovorus]AFY02274.1 Hypothetical protein Bdt_2591 [Bdellovibrio bacteriovorus str. Tiberius]
MKSFIFTITILLATASAKASFERCSVEKLTVPQIQSRIAWLNRCIEQNNAQFFGFTKDSAQYFGVKTEQNSTESTTAVNYPVFGDDERNWAPGEICRVPEGVKFVAVCQWSMTEKLAPPPKPAPSKKEKEYYPPPKRHEVCRVQTC